MLNKIPLLATIGLLFWEQSASGQNAAISEVLKLETAIHEAELKHDVVALESVLADEYVWTNRRGGLMSKQDYLKSLREGKGLASSPGASSNMENIKVRLVGESVAIVTAIDDYRSNTRHLQINVTDVFLKRDGKWQWIASHSSVPPKD